MVRITGSKRIVFLLFFIIGGVIQSQDIRSTLFKEADKAMKLAKENKADLLSPNNFDQGYQYYQQAENDLKDGDDLEDIRETLSKAAIYFTNAYDKTKVGKITFASVMKARDDAFNAEASSFASQLWQKGEKTFRDAAEQLEAGDLDDATELALTAEKFYSDAELDAIKVNYLNETWNLLQKAESQEADEYAGKTLIKSRDLIRQAEKELNENRYDTDVAVGLAKEAKYEVLHAIYITTLIKNMQAKNLTWEDVILVAEGPLSEISNTLDFVAKFDNGYDPVKSEIVQKVNSLLVDKDKLTQENASLNSQVAQYENELKGIAEQQTELKGKLAEIEAKKQKYENVKNMFYTSEAQVILEGSNILIRLVGLTFESGKSVIEPKNFSLLSKVQKAINVYSKCNVIIEGHTDSYGGDKTNLELSQERAVAVHQYLMANMSIDQNRMKAMGFGETKPIANNETKEGREKNRRIDIIIDPGE